MSQTQNRNKIVRHNVDLDEEGGSRSVEDAGMLRGNVICRLIQLSETLTGVSALINMR